jgi:hypothetical protein
MFASIFYGTLWPERICFANADDDDDNDDVTRFKPSPFNKGQFNDDFSNSDKFCHSY